MDPWVPQPMDTYPERLERGRDLRETVRAGKEKPGASGKEQIKEFLCLRVLQQIPPSEPRS